MKIMNIGIIASVDSGKSTLTQKLLEINDKIINKEDKGLITDFHSFEKERGITVFSEGVSLKYRDTHINIIDTPGHTDFFEETKKSLLALDIAIFVISAIDRVTSRVQEIWKILKDKNIPVIVFINKCDIDHSNYLKTYSDLKKLSSTFIDLLDTSNLKEKLAEYSEEYFSKYVEDQIDEVDTKLEVKRQILYGNLNLCIKGSAISGEGINRLLDTIIDYYPKYMKDDEGVKWGLIYKVRYDLKDGLLAYIKLLSGTLNLKDEIETESGTRKINEIRQYKGSEYIKISKLKSGDLGVVRGLEDVKVGEYIGILAPREYKPSEPTFTTSFKSNDYIGLKSAFNILNKEMVFLDPRNNIELSEIEVSSYGEIHLEILKEIIKERFSLETSYSKPIPKYKETISKTSLGFCHYEPKKHYARVQVEISPISYRNNIKTKDYEDTKYIFESKITTDYLPYRYQSIIEKTIPEALSTGVLLGRPVIGIRVKLIDGKAHEEHTHGGDFRIATIRAITQALEQNKNILLEPSLHFLIELSDSSKIILDKLNINNINYEYISNSKDMILGEVPISLKSKLERIAEEANLTVNYTNKNYLECHNTDEIIESLKKTYSTNDILFNSVSLFREKKKMKKVR